MKTKLILEKLFWIGYKIPPYIVKVQEKNVREEYYKNHQSQIDSVQWTKKQEEEFQKFWRPYYGKKADTRGHKYFESCNGVFEPKYISNMLYETLVERKLNPYYAMTVLEKKNLSTYLFSNIDDLYLPKTYLYITHEGEYIADNCFLNIEEIIEKCSDIGRVILKPTVSTARGVGIRICDFENGVDKKTGDSLKDILNNYKKDLLVQEWVMPSIEMQNLYPYSLGTFRVTTYILDGKVYCGPIALRQSVGKAEIDGVNCKGYTIGVNKDTGTLMSTGYFYDEFNQYQMSKHPDTGVVFDGYYVGNINKMINVAKKLHSRITEMGIVSWDLAFGINGEIVFIEVNLSHQGVDINQIATGESLFGENTERMLKKLF